MPPKENKTRMIPRWVVDNDLTKKVVIRVLPWVLGSPFLVVLPLWFFEDELALADNVPLALLIAAVAITVGWTGSHLSTKEMRSRMVPADEWIEGEW